MDKPRKKLDERRAVGSWGAREAGILAVALELFRKEGYEKTSMATVAAAAGLSEGTLYNYFRDKTDLVVRVTLVSLELRVAAAIRAVDESATMAEGLRRLIALHLSAIIEHEEIYRIWVREVRRNDSYAGLPRAAMREIVFGGSEHIGFTALVQRRADKIDVETTAAALADIYLRGFGLNGAAGPQKS